MKKKRKISSLVQIPKLFRRGKKGVYYFRQMLDGVDKWRCTQTSDIGLAREKARSIVGAELKTIMDSKEEKSAKRLADSFVRNITKKEVKRIRMSEALDEFTKMTPGISEVSDRTKKFNKSAFDKFVSWCSSKKVEYADDVTRQTAIEYSGILLEKGYSVKTHNEHLKLLSRVFSTLDCVYHLPDRDPFDRKKVPRMKKTENSLVSHNALEPDQLKTVIECSAAHGKDFRDLFVIGSQTGMRLKDAVMLKWVSVKKDGFIHIVPFKTVKSGNEARVPISKTLKQVLSRRQREKENEYVIPSLAAHYVSNEHYVSKKCSTIFEKALGEGMTTVRKGRRIRSASVYGFHSFRVTFMSLLAQRDVRTRDAMRMLGWDSPEMIAVYERELEKAKGQADERTKKLIDEISELDMAVPEIVPVATKLIPIKKALEGLVPKYSNVVIGKIYGISNVAVKNWMDKFGIKRAKRIESADLTDKEIVKIREKLLKG